jgi:hypothetical protein
VLKRDRKHDAAVAGGRYQPSCARAAGPAGQRCCDEERGSRIRRAISPASRTRRRIGGISCEAGLPCARNTGLTHSHSCLSPRKGRLGIVERAAAPPGGHRRSFINCGHAQLIQRTVAYGNAMLAQVLGGLPACHTLRGIHFRHPFRSHRQFRVTLQLSQRLHISMVHSRVAQCTTCDLTS